uniref:Zinc finger, CCHC-type n=1 Tax=Tanacetum cinerariifolium TaxID=118510 RepID=A0A6L2JXP1_TANCI|nr:hypothetical protein [Tanacetum cinerariifolium]
MKIQDTTYLQNEHYALWEVIEFGDSYVAPQDNAATGSTSEGSAKKKGMTVAVTTEDMQKRKDDVKARTTLLLALPDEHQLRFSKYKTAQELWAAILKTFGGNEATKKTKKNQLKQQYGNFKAEEWLMYTIVWRNKSDLDTMSLDDVYNHLKVYEPEVQKKSESNSQNMAFISSAKNSSGNGEVNTASIPTASTQVSPAGPNVATATISLDTACAYIASQSNGFWKKTGKKISIQGTDVAGFDKSKVECFNCHKMGHFARECRAPRSQERGRRENYRQGSKEEEQAPKALMAIDGVGWDWSFMANGEENHALVADEEAPTEFALMAKSSSDNEVFDNSLCSKTCKKNTDSLNKMLKKEKEGLDNKLTVLSPHLAQVYSPPKKDMSWTGLPEFADDTITDYTKPSPKIGSLFKENQQSELNLEFQEFPLLIENFPLLTENFPVGNSQNNINDKGYWDSGCSRHMTGNISYLTDYEPFDGGYVSFGQGGCKITGKGTIKIECIVLGRNFKLTDDTNVLLRTPRQHNMYSIDLNNVVPHKDLTCLIAKASVDECMLWHRRLCHLNFKTMNKLVRHNLVRGLPSKCFENDHTCVACLKEKQHKASCKTKLVNTVTKPLHTLHMDLFGPTSDETSGILRNFITEIENLKTLRDFSNVRTPQQNRVAERRNRTLIEAARTMLADAKLPVTFWAEAVNTACYVQNRVLVNKSQNKTPYELFNGRTPAIGFLKPFGCHVMILNTLDHLGKFEAKEDECYFIGYSMSSNAFRVFNKRTNRVEENLHVDFLENKAIEKGAGPNWLFDIDSLTNYMNYVPVVVAAHLESSTSNAQDACKADAPESSGNSNPTATSTNPPADQMETLTLETPIPTVSSPVPTACLNDPPQLSSDSRLISKRVTSQDDTPSLDNILTLTNRMQDMSKDVLIPAIDMDTGKYKTCMLNKITKKPFQNVKHETKVLELIYNDLCDLHATSSLGNKKYFVTFIDDASRFCYVYLLHLKDEALDKFKVFKTEVELQQESLIKRFRTDRECEYMDTMYFQSISIIHETTAPYTPQQNGISERKNRVLKEMVNSMLSYFGLSQRFWGEAIVWGCRASVRLPDPKVKTFGESGIECIFVGYAEHSKAFGFYIIEPNDAVAINSIIESRDAIFDEHMFSSIHRLSQRSSEVPGTRDDVFGQHCYCFNVEDDPKTFDEAMKSHDVAFWKEAINDGMDSIMEITLGYGTVEKFKARLVIQGFKHKSGTDYFDTYAPVARISTIRLLIAMASIHNLIIHQMDVKTAFLNGELKEEVYMNQPLGFIMPDNENKIGLRNSVIKVLYEGHERADVILGIWIKHESNGIAISQSHYIENVLKRFNYSDCTPVSTPLDTYEKLMPNKGMAVSQLEYSRVIGCLMYSMTCTRPDIAFAVRKLSRYTSNPGTLALASNSDGAEVLKKTIHYRLVYSGYPSVLEGYTDASWISNTKDNSSTSGWVFLLGGGAFS